MKKIFWWKLICLFFISSFISGCSFVENIFFSKNTIKEFSFSGYVTADGKALEGAIVDCGLNTCTTDEMGYYKFSRINKVVQVSVNKDGYNFSDDLVFVNGTSSDVNFSGFQYFDKSGVVQNNGVIIPNVDIIAESESGIFRTKSNEYGEFFLSHLSGQVKVTASHPQFKFFTQSFNIDKEDDVVISGLTTIKGKINIDCDISAINNDFELSINGKPVTLKNDLTFTIENVELGSQLQLASQEFYIKNESILIFTDLDNITFDCEKYYDVQGVVKSGETILNDAVIKVNDKTIDTTNGEFVLSNLHGKNVISASLKFFEFENITVDKQSNLVLIGKTSIRGKVNLDYGNNFDDIKIVVQDQEFLCDNMGEFLLENIELGSDIEVKSDLYKTPEVFKILDRENLCIDLYKYYDTQIKVSYNDLDLIDVEILVNDNYYYTNENGEVNLNNLFGTVKIQAIKSGYKFEDDYTINQSNQVLNIIPYKLYSVQGRVYSGDILLNNAQIFFGEETLFSENGNFIIDDLYGEVELRISKDGFNEEIMTVSVDNNTININMSYNVTGQVVCGNKAVEGVLVKCGEKSVLTDSQGNFELINLRGNQIITFEKENYQIDELIVSSGCNIVVNSTFSIKGNVCDSLGNVQNLKILLLNTDTMETIFTYTDDMGNYCFSNLNGKYVLFYDSETTLSLKPKIYDVTSGGNYDFSDKGFSFGGKVMSGDLPVSNVLVKVGELTTYTDENGFYKFNLITKPSLLILEKEGYTFINNGLDVDDSFDLREDVNFECTYQISGVVNSGTEKIVGVEVNVGEKTTNTNELGEFVIDGLSGKNNINLAYKNYKFSGVFEVFEYAHLNYIASFDLNLNIKSGEVNVENVNVATENYFVTSDQLGLCTLQNIQLGDVITLEKSGYDFQNYEVVEYIDEILIINGTYSVDGIISNSQIPLEGVVVSCGSNTTTTDENGYYILSGLQGISELNFEKENFEFDSQIVSCTQTLNISSKYSVSGYVKLGTTPLSGVLIDAGEVTTTTNALGYFVIEGLNQKITLSFEKQGYEFSGDFEVSSPTVLEVKATYIISGKVTSGDLIIAGANILTSTGVSTTTDNQGNYILYGLDETVTLTVSKDGYNSITKNNVFNYTPNCNFDLSYNVTITFTGATDFSDITITIGKISEVYSQNVVVLESLYGNNLIRFSKVSYGFNPNEYMVEKSTQISVTLKYVYSIQGTLKTTSGAPVCGAYIYAGDVYGKTDETGYYSIDGLSGTNQLKIVLPSWGNNPYEKRDIQVNTGGNYNLTISDYDFAYEFLNFSYDNLRNAKSYQIFGTGIVNPHTSFAEKQNIRVVYKQDEYGNKVFENKNYGKKISILGITVDPNVSMLSYFNMNTKEVKYQQIKGENNVTENNVNYTDTWSATTDFVSYKEEFGIDANNFYPYTISKDTISNISQVSISEDGSYCFTISLKCNKNSANEPSYFYYAKLMRKMCADQDLVGFSYINLTYTISKSGLIKNMAISEYYTVTSKGTTVDTDASINYTFRINSLTETIVPINTTSPKTVANQLAEEIAVEKNSINFVIDFGKIISNKRRHVL